MGVNHDTVLVVDVTEALYITVPHEFLDLCDELCSLVLYRTYGVPCDWGITNALEEFDAFFSLQVLEMTVLLDEVLLHHSHLTSLVVIRSSGEIDVTGVSSAKIQGVSIHGLHGVGLLSLAEGVFRDLLEAHSGTSTGRSLKHLTLIGEESPGVDLARLEIGFLLRLDILRAVSHVLTGGQSVTHDSAEDWL